MARYTGAVCRLCRRSGEKLMLKGSRCYTPKCSVERRHKPPGQQIGRRRRLSDRGMQLREKQKARYIYGIMERQFRRHFREAERKTGITGDLLLVLLERRLDNVVYRLGFADSRSQARQLVEHGHIIVNTRRVDVPSALIKEGDIICWGQGGQKTEYYKDLLKGIESKAIPNWLSLDKQQLIGRMVSLPTPIEAGAKFVGQTIVEFYSR